MTHQTVKFKNRHLTIIIVMVLIVILFPSTCLGNPIYGVHVINVSAMGEIGGGQDGVISNNYIFRFTSMGKCSVYKVETGSYICSFQLDKYEKIKSHSNSACFGKSFYSTKDEFPLLYCNIYNNHVNDKDKKLGTCCVYRIIRNGSIFSSQLVQVIRIGFVEDTTMWKSGSSDVRPYGNFIIDIDNNSLYAYTMRDTNRTTRFFRFSVPTLEEGSYDEYIGCNVVTLNSSDINSYFDIPYSYYIQGVCYYDGKVFSLEGFTESGRLKVIDLNEKKLLIEYPTAQYFGQTEPEMIVQQDGIFYYADVSGNLYTFSISSEHIWDKGFIKRKPNYKSTGIKLFTCTICGQVKEETIPVLDRFSLASCTVSGIKNKTYNGKRITQTLSIKHNNTTLKQGTDFTVSYKNNINTGIAKIILTGKEKYKESITKTFYIKPARTQISKLIPSIGRVKLNWNKAKSGTGYEVQYKIRGTRKYQSTLIKGLKKNSRTIKSLEKKTYQFRVRAYKKVGRKMLYSKWSKVRTVKVK